MQIIPTLAPNVYHEDPLSPVPEQALGRDLDATQSASSSSSSESEGVRKDAERNSAPNRPNEPKDPTTHPFWNHRP